MGPAVILVEIQTTGDNAFFFVCLVYGCLLVKDIVGFDLSLVPEGPEDHASIWPCSISHRVLVPSGRYLLIL